MAWIQTFPFLTCSWKWWYLRAACLVRGPNFGILASSRAPLLSSYYTSAISALILFLYCTSGVEYLISSMVDTSSTNVIKGIKSCIAWECRMYSASVVLSTISVCSLLTHKIGQLAYMMKNPVHEYTLLGSIGSSCPMHQWSLHLRSTWCLLTSPASGLTLHIQYASSTTQSFLQQSHGTVLGQCWTEHIDAPWTGSLVSWCIGNSSFIPSNGKTVPAFCVFCQDLSWLCWHTMLLLICEICKIDDSPHQEWLTQLQFVSFFIFYLFNFNS